MQHLTKLRKGACVSKATGNGAQSPLLRVPSPKIQFSPSAQGLSPSPSEPSVHQSTCGRRAVEQENNLRSIIRSMNQTKHTHTPACGGLRPSALMLERVESLAHPRCLAWPIHSALAHNESGCAPLATLARLSQPASAPPHRSTVEREYT